MRIAPPTPSRFRNWVRHRYRRDDQGISKVQIAIIAGAALILMTPLMLLPLFFAAGPALYNATHGDDSDCGGGGGAQPPASGNAKSIPRSYLDLYKKMGAKYGVQWNVLAGIGREETNHGRLQAKGVLSGENDWGAGGPMQFLQPTFEQYGVDANHNGKKSRYEPADAISASARMLKANGAPGDLWKAIWAYNHASFYVKAVLKYAKGYASGDFEVQNDDPQPACEENAVPAGSSAAVKAVIEYAQKQLKKPYGWGDTGPDSFDCSGLTMMAYRSIGVNIPRISEQQVHFGKKIPKGKEQPGDLVFFGDPNAPHHVGLVVKKGKMINAPHTGDVVRYANYYSGYSDLSAFARPLADPSAHPKSSDK